MRQKKRLKEVLGQEWKARIDVAADPYRFDAGKVTSTSNIFVLQNFFLSHNCTGFETVLKLNFSFSGRD